MTLARQAFGRFGEDAACAALEARGYTVLTRRFRTRSGELDIVAQHGDYLVFVEVKARHDQQFGDAEEAVTLQKQQKIVRMATEYLAAHGLHEVPCRFDVVAVDSAGDPPRITVIADAFRPGW